jgi:hypothetical protein
MHIHHRLKVILIVVALVAAIPALTYSQEGEELVEDAAEVETEAEVADDAAFEGDGDEDSTTDTEASGTSFGTKPLKIQEIVEKIKALQKKIKQSQERMDEVVKIVLNTEDSKGAKAIIALENSMGGSFVAIQAVVTLDGAPIFKKSDDDGILDAGELEVFNGAILPGEHTLSVLFVYRGAGYGIFSYLQGYRFKVRSSTKFNVKEGKGIKIKVIGYEKGDQDTKMEDRPAIKYVQQKIDVD